MDKDCMSIIGTGAQTAILPAVPAQNSTDNNTMSDVIGNKTDGHDGDSIYAITHTVEEHFHKPSRVYPSLADGISVSAVSGAGTWTLGTIVEIIPASTFSDDFDIHHVSVEDISGNGVFELVLYAGASDTEIGRVRFIRSSNFVSTTNIPMQTPIIAASDRVRARLASDDDGGQVVVVSMKLHEY